MYEGREVSKNERKIYQLLLYHGEQVTQESIVLLRHPVLVWCEREEKKFFVRQRDSFGS